MKKQEIIEKYGLTEFEEKILTELLIIQGHLRKLRKIIKEEGYTYTCSLHLLKKISLNVQVEQNYMKNYNNYLKVLLTSLNDPQRKSELAEKTNEAEINNLIQLAANE